MTHAHSNHSTKLLNKAAGTKPMFPPRPEAQKGANGEAMVGWTYTNWRYKVTVQSNGAIHVNQGDWLSKYSAAIYNDFRHIHEFGRMDLQTGKVKAISNVNRIYTGETIYHIPTHEKFGGKAPTTETKPLPPPPLPDAVKKAMIKDLLDKDFDLQGEHLTIACKAVDYMGYAENAITVAEIAGIVAEGGAIVGGGTVLSIVGTLLGPFVGLIALVNASEAGERMCGMRAIAYGITAWAFSDPLPPFPGSWRRNLVTGGFTSEVRGHERAWNKARDSAVKGLDDVVAKHKRKKESYQLVYRAVGDDDRKKLATMLLKGLEKRLEGTRAEKERFWSPAPDYPVQ